MSAFKQWAQNAYGYHNESFKLDWNEFTLGNQILPGTHTTLFEQPTDSYLICISKNVGNIDLI